MSIEITDGEPTMSLLDYQSVVNKSKDLPVPTHEQLEAFSSALGIDPQTGLKLMIQIALSCES